MNAPLPRHILQQNLDLHHELNVDLFAGGGGWSEGVHLASGRDPDIAINHNDDALSMHRINHPDTRHFAADVFEVDPRTVTQGRPVGHLHASPDCTHHSQAAGGQPRNEKRRALSWVVIRWVGQLKKTGKPVRVLTLENVKQVLQWGPLVAKRDKSTGRVVTLEIVTDPASGKMVNRVADRGERVPRELQYLVPDKKRKGQTWRKFVSMLEDLGYEVGVQMMKAADFGAGTTRDRLFLHARNDGLPVTFPEPSHFKNKKHGQARWSAAYEHIDFNLPTRSIFDRPKPLAESTMKRIAKGMKRFVIDNPDPFIVQVTQSGNMGGGVRSTIEPLPTITTAKGGEFALVSPVMIQAAHGEGAEGKAKRWGEGSKSVEDPLGTLTASGGHAVAMAHLLNMKFDCEGGDLKNPLPTITAGGNSKREAGAAHSMGITMAHLCTLRKNVDAESIDEPISTICTSGAHHSLIEYQLSPDDEAKALRVSAFLISYYGTDNISDPRAPLPTITTKDRLALVTVYHKGTPYLIVDIHMRMLTPPELFSAQGFGKHYIITHGHDGRKFNISTQVKMCGNSVSPKPARALYTECHKNDGMLIRKVAA